MAGRSIHVLQHSESEGAAGAGRWAERQGFRVQICHLYQGESLPDLAEVECLWIMGGPMNIYQDRDYPWLKEERAYLEKALEVGKKMLGFCLGSQLLADALGARVHQNAWMEIGWYPVEMSGEAGREPGFGHFPDRLQVLHWHGDTFELPAEARLLASSEACGHQAFAWNGKVIGFQFHMEVEVRDLDGFIGCGQDLKNPGPHVQTEEEIRGGAAIHAARAQEVLAGFLEEFTAK
ncbi:MAG: type 1 glutamine amidotransferase [Blastochloris sp.]|nr:type 1 glutamine amidotransferase [Blastochloris sp.]